MAHTRGLDSAEGHFIVSKMNLIDPGHPGINVADRPVGPFHVVRPDGGAQPPLGLVGFLDGFIQAFHFPHRQYRSKHLFGVQLTIFRHIHHHRWFKEMSRFQVRILGPLTSNQDLRALSDGISQLPFDLFSLILRMQRAHPNLRLLGFGGAIPRLVVTHFFEKSFHKAVVNLFEQIQTLDCKTGLPGVPISADHGPADSPSHIRIGTNNHGVGPTELQCDPLEIWTGQFHHSPPRFRRTRQSNSSDSRMIDEGLAHLFTWPGHAIQHTRRQPGLIQQPDHLESRQRRRTCRLDDDGIPSNQGWTHFGPH